MKINKLIQHYQNKIKSSQAQLKELRKDGDDYGIEEMIKVIEAEVRCYRGFVKGLEKIEESNCSGVLNFLNTLIDEYSVEGEVSHDTINAAISIRSHIVADELI